MDIRQLLRQSAQFVDPTKSAGVLVVTYY